MTATKNEGHYFAFASLLDNFNLSNAAYKLACLLLKSHNIVTGYSFKSKRTMAKECECSISTISRALRELTKQQIINIKPHNDEERFNRQTSNKYFVNYKILKAKNKCIYKVAKGCEALQGAQIKIYNYIARKIGSRGEWSLSYTDIAKACHVSTSTVYKALKVLKEQNLINVETKKENNSYAKNIFRLVFEFKNTKLAPDIQKRKEQNDMTVKEKYNKLSAEAKKAFNILLKNDRYISCTRDKFAELISKNKTKANKAIAELAHYQLLSIFSTPGQAKLSFILENDYSNRCNDLPVLPDDTANAEPFILPLNQTFFALSDLTDEEHKTLYFIWNYRAVKHIQATFENICTYCNYKKQETAKQIVNGLICKKLIAIDSNYTYYLVNKELQARAIKDFDIFNLESKVFKVYSLLYYLKGDKNKIYIDKLTIKKYCKYSLSSISSYIAKMRDLRLIKSIPFYTTFGGRLANIQQIL